MIRGIIPEWMYLRQEEAGAESAPALTYSRTNQMSGKHKRQMIRRFWAGEEAVEEVNRTRYSLCIKSHTIDTERIALGSTISLNNCSLLISNILICLYHITMVETKPWGGDGRYGLVSNGPSLLTSRGPISLAASKVKLQALLFWARFRKRSTAPSTVSWSTRLLHQTHVTCPLTAMETSLPSGFMKVVWI